MLKKLWKRMKLTHRIMAVGDVVGGFGLALLIFSYMGQLQQLTLGWIMIVLSILLHIPYIIENA